MTFKNTFAEQWVASLRSDLEKNIPICTINRAPTGSGKSTIVSTLPKEFPGTLLVFISTTNALVKDFRERLQKQGTPYYVLRSNDLLEREEHHFMQKTAQDILALAKECNLLLKHTGALDKISKGNLPPKGSASKIKDSLKSILMHGSMRMTTVQFKKWILERPLHGLLEKWNPLQLFPFQPRTLLMTADMSCRSNTIYGGGKQSWYVESMAQMGEYIEEWESHDQIHFGRWLVVYDEADAAYASMLNQLSRETPDNLDIARALQQWQDLSDLYCIEYFTLEQWRSLMHHSNDLLRWYRELADAERISRIYKSSDVVQAALEQSLLEHPDLAIWWRMQSERKHAHSLQKLQSCKFFWSTAMAQCEGDAKRAYYKYMGWLKLLTHLRAIRMTKQDYIHIVGSYGGLFHTTARSVQTQEIERMPFQADPLHRGHFEIKSGDGLSHTIDVGEFRSLFSAVDRFIRNQWDYEPTRRDMGFYAEVASWQQEGRQFTNQAHIDLSFEQLHQPLSPEYVYHDFKSKLSLVPLEEIQQSKLESIELSWKLMETKGSPEQEIIRWLDQGSVVILASATIGLSGMRLSTFNLDYITAWMQEHLPEWEVSKMSAECAQSIRDMTRDIISKRAINVHYLEKLSTSAYDPEDLHPSVREWVQVAYPLLPEKSIHMEATNTLCNDWRMVLHSMFSHYQSGLVLHLTNTRMMKDFMHYADKIPSVVKPHPQYEAVYFIDVKAFAEQWKLTGSSSLQGTMTVVLYSAEFIKQFDDDKMFRELLDVSKGPVLVYSAVASASRGINFPFNDAGGDRDLDMLSITSIPYYGEKIKDSEPYANQEYLKHELLYHPEASLLDVTLAEPVRKDMIVERIREQEVQRLLIQMLGRACRYGQPGHTSVYIVPEVSDFVNKIYKPWEMDTYGAAVLQRVYEMSKHVISEWVENHESHRQRAYWQHVHVDGLGAKVIHEIRQGNRTYQAAWVALRKKDLYHQQWNYSKIEDLLGILGYPSPFLYLNKRDRVYCASYQGMQYLTDINDPLCDSGRVYDYTAVFGRERIKSVTGLQLEPGLSNEAHQVAVHPWFIQTFLKGIVGELVVANYLNHGVALYPTWASIQEEDLWGSEQTQQFEKADLWYINHVERKILAVDAKSWGPKYDRQLDSVQFFEGVRKKRDDLRALLSAHAALSHYELGYAVINALGNAGEMSREGCWVGAAYIPIIDGNKNKNTPSWVMNHHHLFQGTF